MVVRAGRKTKKQLEQDFQISLVRDLRRILLAWTVVVVHVPNGGWRTPAEGGILKAMGVMAGFPDLLIIHLGRAYGIELKTDAGALSKDQRAAHIVLDNAQMKLGTCRTLDEVLGQLRAWNIPTKIKGG
jgi:hypothetical protein